MAPKKTFSLTDKGYNPDSIDSMLTKILEKLESHDDKFEALLESSKSMDSRVGTLEQAHWKQMGIVTTVSIAASAAWGFFTGK